MKTVGAFEAKTKLSQLLREVEEHHEEIIIQKHNRNVARLIPFEEEHKSGFSKEEIVNGFQKIRKTQKSEKGVIKKMIMEGRKR